MLHCLEICAYRSRQSDASIKDPFIRLGSKFYADLSSLPSTDIYPSQERNVGLQDLPPWLCQ